MIKGISKNNIIDKLQNPDNQKMIREETILYYIQNNFQKEQKSSNENLISRIKLFSQYIIIILFIKAAFSFYNSQSEIILKQK